MAEVYLLLGSNEGDAANNLLRAQAAINTRVGEIVSCSSVYETEAWGIKEQASFLNQALLLETILDPEALLKILKLTEQQLGRVETIKWGPRVIDIDILFYDDAIVDLLDLKIPHPFLHQRRFTLAPMSEIAAGFMHPVLKKTIAELLVECPDKSLVKKR